MNAIKMYFIGAFAEIRKVTWPTREQTIAYSLLVIGLSIGLALFFSVLDYGFNTAISAIINK